MAKRKTNSVSQFMEDVQNDRPAKRKNFFDHLKPEEQKVLLTAIKAVKGSKSRATLRGIHEAAKRNFGVTVKLSCFQDWASSIEV